MVEFVELRVHVPQNEHDQAPLVCTTFPRRHRIGPTAWSQVKSSQVNTLPKTKSQAKDKRAKDRQ